MRALGCLVAIMEQGSLTQAAAVLHIWQPALSHQIAAIERELGTPVIERLPWGIRPTAAGLAAEPLAHYNPDNGFVMWIDQFAAARGVVLPQPSLQTGFPRTAAQLAAAGMGVTIVPFSPHDDLLRRFVGDLKRRGLPDSRIAYLRLTEPLSAPGRAAVMPGDADPVAAYAGCAP